MFRQGGKSTSYAAGGKKTVHTTFEDGAELIEEYNEKTDELLVRKRRTKTALGADGQWEYLVGDAPTRMNPEATGISVNASNPMFHRKDTDKHFQWRVRNLPYPSDNYDISIDSEKRQIVIRTKNKKYYKRFGIPELDVIGANLLEGALTWYHANHTLVISYQKPKEVLDEEVKDKMERKKLATQQEDDAQCKQQ